MYTPDVNFGDFEDMPDSVSFDGFNFSDHYNGERDILQPQLENLGYTVVAWYDGDADGFGTLSRYAVCRKGGDTHRFMYG